MAGSPRLAPLLPRTLGTTLSTTLVVSAQGAADPAQAWDRYTIPSRWAQWSPQISDVVVTNPDRRVEVGTRGVVRGPAGVTVAFEVTEVDPTRRRWTWRVHAGLVPLLLGHGVDPTANGSRAWVRITGALPVVLAYAPLARLALGRLVAARPAGEGHAG